MKAVYDDGREGLIFGVSSDVREAVDEVLRRHPECVKIWIVEDDAPDDPSAYLFTVPDWTLEKVFITRADGKVSKAWLGSFSGEGIWESIEREFPITYDLLISEALDFMDADWELCFFPGEDSELARWYEEGQRCPARLPPAIHATSCPASASRTSTCSPARRGNAFATARPTSSYG